MGRLPLTFFLCCLHLLLGPEIPSAAAAAAGSNDTNQVILLNCGTRGKSTDDDGRTWSGDESFPGLSSTRSVTAIKQISVSAAPFANARVFSSPFTYSIAVSRERYFLRLHFYLETYSNYSPSSAVFNVSCGDLTLLQNFSPSSYYTNDRRSITKEYSINASSSSVGWMNLTFTPSSLSSAFVNGIELVSMPNIFTGKTPTVTGLNTLFAVRDSIPAETMYRFNVGGKIITSSEDSGKLYRMWYDDTDYMPGGAVGVSFPKDPNVTIEYPETLPEYIAPEAVYATARSMPEFNGTINLNYNLSWILTVDPGFPYLVRLHFCEIQSFISLQNERVFNIYIANQTAAQGFDIIVQSGGNGIPVYFDSVVMMQEGSTQQQIWVSLYPRNQFGTLYTNVLLNGLEIFKLGTDGNLAGVNPTPPPQVNPDPPSGKSGGGRSGAIGGAIGGAVAGLLLIGCFAFFWHRKRGKEVVGSDHKWLPVSITSSADKSTTVSLGSTLPSNLCRHFSFADIKTATNEFDEKLILGVGGFGKVYRGSIDDGATTVAIKRSNPASQQGIREFQNEIEMLSKLRHRHLVSLIGYCEEEGEMILVYDYMARGTLREHLYKSNNPPLSWKQRLEICIGAARGLHYLHTGAKYTIIHRDVKSTNILLDDNWVAKVADFGLSKMESSLDNTHVSTVVKGSFGYLDPEYFRRQQLTEKSDVYSFGVVLFEVLCARPALLVNLPKEQISLADWALYCQRKGVLADIIDPKLQGKIAPQCLKTFADTAEKCLADVGLDRPAMGDVLWNLEFALQLQESAEIKGSVDAWDGERGERIYNNLGGRDTTDMSTTSTSTGLYDRSIASTESDGMTPSTVFSQIVDARGR